MTPYLHPAANDRHSPAAKALADLRMRQIAFGLCCRMPRGMIAEITGLSPGSLDAAIERLLSKTGMGSPFEFALQQNAAVRRLIYGDE